MPTMAATLAIADATPATVNSPDTFGVQQLTFGCVSSKVPPTDTDA
jgi:hypothetical protein